MKLNLTIAFFLIAILTTSCQREPTAETAAVGNPSNLVDRVVEASCGQCQFEMEGEGCDLAIRIDGQTFYVDGSSVDDHGDAHGDAGLCNCIRQAKVSGMLKDGRFVATSFEVLPNDESAKGEHQDDR